MDPNVTLKLLSEALQSGDKARVEELTEALAQWLHKGGFEPEWDQYPDADLHMQNTYGQNEAYPEDTVDKSDLFPYLQEDIEIDMTDWLKCRLNE